jgi:hypothetical protein
VLDHVLSPAAIDASLAATRSRPKFPLVGRA